MYFCTSGICLFDDAVTSGLAFVTSISVKLHQEESASVSTFKLLSKVQQNDLMQFLLYCNQESQVSATAESESQEF